MFPKTELVERPTDDILKDLRNYATGHLEFKMKSLGEKADFSRRWLTREAEKSAFSGWNGIKRLIPPVARHAREAHERAILSALCAVTGIKEVQPKP